MLLNGVPATIVAILGISVALVLSPWNTASLYTTEHIDATAAIVREKCLNYSLQKNWTNNFSANITVTNLATFARVSDARTLRKGDVIQIDNYFGSGRTAVRENSDSVFALKGTKFGTTAAHTWEFVTLEGDHTTRLVQRETWSGGVSFLFMRFGPVRPLLERMFAGFNGEVKQSAEGAERVNAIVLATLLGLVRIDCNEQ